MSIMGPFGPLACYLCAGPARIQIPNGMWLCGRCQVEHGPGGADELHRLLKEQMVERRA